jgi:hypothetical protein
MDEADRRLTSKREPGETVLARGRFDEPSHDPRADLPTGGHAHLVVTDRTILWTARLGDTSLALSTVTGFTEITQFQRYAIDLRHVPVERSEWVPAHRLLWWRWGNAEVLVQASETTFVFSHRETKAARAIRDRLTELGVPSGQPVTMPRRRPRDEGKAYFQLARTRPWRRRLRAPRR